ncbi:response regulator [Algoriphagus persicinus]|uniref:response regulator n=1 Tax=Algoriphagus persicinus TaxID=3108754 RepID=UPI002B377C3D|nr:response regulator [Algoriphagus sp. E1-3-M2]MEB2784208.1 response regulator [Algoriphagus sp. E1-3-M2]
MIKNILLVDDDPISQLIASKLIRKFETDITISSHLNGKVALEFLTKEFNDLDSFIVLLDINMPVMNGWEFLDELAQVSFCAKIKIYIVSSSTDEEDLLKASTYTNVAKFISKPIKNKDYEEILDLPFK